ncbi:glycosyltransferase family 10 [Nostoc sp. NIES-2111]
MNISFVPFYDHFLNNRLFKFENIWTKHWQEGNVKLYQECMQRGYRIGTWDELPVESADVVVFQDYPQSIETLSQVKQRSPHARTLLMLYETPLNNPHWFNRRNHQLFDAVLTYNPHLVDNNKYFKMYLPIGMPPQAQVEIPFEKRHPLVVLNTNRYIGLRSLPRPGQYLNHLQVLRQAGWHCTFMEFVRSTQGDLNRHRRNLARVAEKLYPNAVDIFGHGWEGRNSGWYYRLFPDPPYLLAKGSAQEDKLQLLSRYRFTIAYENFEGNVGYISEKIFDALYAGTVPIYRGDRDISQYVWPECFVDHRNFRNEAELLHFVMNCSKNHWQQMREAGYRYLHSEQIKLFQPEYYATCILSVIESLFDSLACKVDTTYS